MCKEISLYIYTHCLFFNVWSMYWEVLIALESRFALNILTRAFTSILNCCFRLPFHWKSLIYFEYFPVTFLSIFQWPTLKLLLNILPVLHDGSLFSCKFNAIFRAFVDICFTVAKSLKLFSKISKHNTKTKFKKCVRLHSTYFIIM